MPIFFFKKKMETMPKIYKNDTIAQICVLEPVVSLSMCIHHMNGIILKKKKTIEINSQVFIWKNTKIIFYLKDLLQIEIIINFFYEK